MKLDRRGFFWHVPSLFVSWRGSYILDRTPKVPDDSNRQAGADLNALLGQAEAGELPRELVNMVDDALAEFDVNAGPCGAEAACRAALRYLANLGVQR